MVVDEEDEAGEVGVLVLSLGGEGGVGDEVVGGGGHGRVACAARFTSLTRMTRLDPVCVLLYIVAAPRCAAALTL